MGLNLRHEETEPQEGRGFRPRPAPGPRPHLTSVNDAHVLYSCNYDNNRQWVSLTNYDPGQDSPPSAFREPPLSVLTEPSLQVPCYLHFTEDETEAQRG